MQNKIVSALKKDHIVKDKKKRTKVLLKVIESIYDKNPEMQDEIDASMVEVAPEEGVSPELVFLFCLFCCPFYNGYSRKKSKQECWRQTLCEKSALGNSKDYIKKGGDF